jgi:hypothetical protein
MAHTLSPVSVHQLHRMLPSDLEKLKTTLSTNEGASSVVDIFGQYLIALKEPTAVELDDVARITLQLNSVGLWNVKRPESFIQKLSASLDREVLKTLCAVLNVPFASQADSDTQKADQSAAIGEALVRPQREKAPSNLFIGADVSRPHRKVLITPKGIAVHLTRMEAEILRVLSEAKNPVSREELLREVAVSSQKLDHEMDRLQRKVREGGAMMAIKVTEAGNYELITRNSSDRPKLP